MISIEVPLGSTSENQLDHDCWLDAISGWSDGGVLALCLVVSRLSFSIDIVRLMQATWIYSELDPSEERQKVTVSPAGLLSSMPKGWFVR